MIKFKVLIKFTLDKYCNFDVNAKSFSSFILIIFQCLTDHLRQLSNSLLEYTYQASFFQGFVDLNKNVK